MSAAWCASFHSYGFITVPASTLAAAHGSWEPFLAVTDLLVLPSLLYIIIVPDVI